MTSAREVPRKACWRTCLDYKLRRRLTTMTAGRMRTQDNDLRVKPHPRLAYISVEHCNKIKRSCPWGNYILAQSARPHWANCLHIIDCRQQSLVYVAASCDSQWDLSIFIPHDLPLLSHDSLSLSISFSIMLSLCLVLLHYIWERNQVNSR